MTRMRETVLSLLLMLGMPAFTAAWEAPDDEKIFNVINDGTSPGYYPLLLSKYMEGDTTLTAADFINLYYGYAYQDAYRPLDATPKEVDDLMTLLASVSEPDLAESLRLIKAGEEALRADPFNLQVINILVYAYGLTGEKNGEQINYFRLKNVINTIKSSGTGLSQTAPWHVLTFATETDLISSMGLQPTKRMIISRTVDYIPLLVKTDEGVKGYYFDFGRIYWKKPENFDRKRPKGFEINGMKPALVK